MSAKCTTYTVVHTSNLKMHKIKSVRDDRDLKRAGFIELPFLQISDLCTIPTRFSESLNEENQMCELCMFSQIRSHIFCILYSINIS